MFCDCAIPRTAGKAPVWDTTLAVGEGERFARRGAEIFARNCAGCHGRDGLARRSRGRGPHARPKQPDHGLLLRPFPERIALERSSGLVHAVLERPSQQRLDGARGLREDDRSDRTAAGTHRARAGDGGRPSSSNNVPFATARTGPATVLRRRSWLRPRPIFARSGPRWPARGGIDKRGPGDRDAEMGAETHAGRALVIGSLRSVVLRESNRGVT